MGVHWIFYLHCDNNSKAIGAAFSLRSALNQECSFLVSFLRIETFQGTQKLFVAKRGCVLNHVTIGVATHSMQGFEHIA